jgi:hypothetical protein
MKNLDKFLIARTKLKDNLFKKRVSHMLFKNHVFFHMQWHHFYRLSCVGSSSNSVWRKTLSLILLF